MEETKKTEYKDLPTSLKWKANIFTFLILSPIIIPGAYMCYLGLKGAFYMLVIAHGFNMSL